MLKPYKVSDELEAKLNALRSRASPERREPTPEDLEMREVLIAGYGVSEETAENPESGTQGEGSGDEQEGEEAAGGGASGGHEAESSEEQS